MCKEWESATAEAEKQGIRTVHLRTGVVLDKKGGMLAKQLPFFKMGFGGYLGSGEQSMSWITLQDWIAACEFLIFNSDLSGPVNLTAPNPVSSRDFAKTLAAVLKRPCRLHIPEALILWRYGEMGRVLMLEGSKVLPGRLLEAGFEFQYPELRAALQACIAK